MNLRESISFDYLVESRILLMEHKYPIPLILDFRFFLFFCLFYIRLGEVRVRLAPQELELEKNENLK